MGFGFLFFILLLSSLYLCSTCQLKNFAILFIYSKTGFKILNAYLRVEVLKNNLSMLKMLKRNLLLSKMNLDSRFALASIILVANAFIWYMYAFNILTEITKKITLDTFETLMIWTINFVGAAIFALAGAALTTKLGKRVQFLLFWMLLGVVSSLTPLLLGVTTKTSVSIISFLFGASFGLGMPASMAYFADSSVVENRARFGGMIFFIIGLGAFLLGITVVSDITIQILILIAWRGLGLITFFAVKPSEKPFKEEKNSSYGAILVQRPFFLYFIPWFMFCLVNYASAPVLVKVFSADFINLSTAIEGVLIGVFAIVGGFFSDTIGRKRVTIAGFIMIGLGYAILGVFSESLFSWFLYTIADGVAWGMFHTVFLMTLWGDLAYDAPSEKYYALGGLPFLLSNFLRIATGSYIAETVSAYAVFTFASIFLFLAVIPLMYAPETLPEKKIKDRELKQYIDRAKKIKGKYA
jgi:MFS family permease